MRSTRVGGHTLSRVIVHSFERERARESWKKKEVEQTKRGPFVAKGNAFQGRIWQAFQGKSTTLIAGHTVWIE
jgi:hypothetical protein